MLIFRTKPVTKLFVVSRYWNLISTFLSVGFSRCFMLVTGQFRNTCHNIGDVDWISRSRPTYYLNNIELFFWIFRESKPSITRKGTESGSEEDEAVYECPGLAPVVRFKIFFRTAWFFQMVWWPGGYKRYFLNKDINLGWCRKIRSWLKPNLL